MRTFAFWSKCTFWLKLHFGKNMRFGQTVKIQSKCAYLIKICVFGQNIHFGQNVQFHSKYEMIFKLFRPWVPGLAASLPIMWARRRWTCIRHLRQLSYLPCTVSVKDSMNQQLCCNGIIRHHLKNNLGGCQ